MRPANRSLPQRARPVLLIFLWAGSAGPRPRLLQDVKAAMRRCDGRSQVRLCRMTMPGRGTDIQLLGEWRCPLQQVRQALATLYCEQGAADG